MSFSSVQSLSRVRLFATLWIAARQASLSITISRSSFNERRRFPSTLLPSRDMCRWLGPYPACLGSRPQPQLRGSSPWDKTWDESGCLCPQHFLPVLGLVWWWEEAAAAFWRRGFSDHPAFVTSDTPLLCASFFFCQIVLEGGSPRFFPLWSPLGKCLRQVFSLLHFHFY